MKPATALTPSEPEAVAPTAPRSAHGPGRWLWPLLVLALGAAGAVALWSLRPAAKPEAPAAPVPKVEALKLTPQPAQFQLQATGTVSAEREVQLVPEVGGKVVWVSKDLRPGGQVRKGQVLVRLDARQYQLALDQERSRIRQAELELELEEGRASVAKEAWQALGKEGDAQAPLALRKSQLETARMQLEAGQSSLKNAQLNLERTTLRAPFDAMVISEQVEVGQVVVGNQSSLAQLVGTQAMRATVTVPPEALARLAVPGVNAKEGARARVRQTLVDSAPIEREARVAGLVGQLNPETRRAELVLEITRPIDPELGLPLLPGAYVEVTLLGENVEDAVALPSEAVQEGSWVWLLDGSQRLLRQPVAPLWRTTSQLFVRDPKLRGATLVLRAPNGALPGQAVQVLADAATQEADGE